MPNFFDAVNLVGAYDGVSQTYTLPSMPDPPEALYLIYDGVLLLQGYDYTLAGNTVSLMHEKPKLGSILRAYYRVPSPPPDDGLVTYIANDNPTGVIDGSNTTFHLANIPFPGSSLILTLDGVHLFQPTDYTILGSIITFVIPPKIGSILLGSYRGSGSVPGPPPPIRINSYPKSGIIPYIRNYLNDPAGVLWNDNQLQRWISQAEIEVTQRLAIYWAKFPLALVNGQGTYQMPYNLRGITRMTYRGTPVEMLTQKQVAELSPVYRTQKSRVLYAYLQFEGYYSLRLFCTPYEDLPILSQGTDIYTDANIREEFHIGGFFYATEASPNFILPDYLYRRTVRYYTCWKAFSIEGDGQDLQVGQYYRQKFEEQVARNGQFLAKIYAAKEKQLSPQFLNVTRKVARPVLPPNYGPTVPR